MDKLRRVIRRIILREVDAKIEKQEVAGWIVERMPGYVSVDNKDAVFIEIDNRGMFIHIGNEMAFVPGAVVGNLELPWF